MTQQRPASTQRGERKYTWDDTIAAIGKDFSGGRERVAQEPIEAETIVRYCEVWEIGNPIYWHEDKAKQSGYKGVVAPWSSIKQAYTYTSFWRPGQPTRFPLGADKDTTMALPDEGPDPTPKPVTNSGVVSDVAIEFFEPVVVGDRLTTKGNKLVNVRVRETKVGYGAFTNRESQIFNQRGQLVARVNQGGYSYNIGEKAPK